MDAFAVVDEAEVIIEEIVLDAQLNGQLVGAIVIPPDLNGDNRVNIPRFLRESARQAENMYTAMEWIGEVLIVFSHFNPYGKIRRRTSGFVETLVLAYPLPTFDFEIGRYRDGSLINESMEQEGVEQESVEQEVLDDSRYLDEDNDDSENNSMESATRDDELSLSVESIDTVLPNSAFQEHSIHWRYECKAIWECIERNHESSFAPQEIKDLLTEIKRFESNDVGRLSTNLDFLLYKNTMKYRFIHATLGYVSLPFHSPWLGEVARFIARRGFPSNDLETPLFAMEFLATFEGQLQLLDGLERLFQTEIGSIMQNYVTGYVEHLNTWVQDNFDALWIV
jgi:hypothetical protein